MRMSGSLRKFANFSTSVDLLPFDHHMLAGLVAPRGLFVIDNSAILWLGPWSCYGCMKTANKIWQALGVPDSMGFSQIGNHSHCQFPASQQGNLTAFVNKFLVRRSRKYEYNGYWPEYHVWRKAVGWLASSQAVLSNIFTCIERKCHGKE